MQTKTLSSFFLLFFVFSAPFKALCFNTDYFQRSWPDHPNQKIELGNDVTERLSSFEDSKSFSIYGEQKTNISLHWISVENIVLDLEEYGSYIVFPDKSKYRLATETEDYLFKSSIFGKIEVFNYDNKGWSETKSVLTKIIGGSNIIPLKGRFVASGQGFDFNLTVNYQCVPQFPVAVCGSGKIYGSLEGNSSAFPSLYFDEFIPGGDEPEILSKVKLILSKFKISPKQRYVNWKTRLYEIKEKRVSKNIKQISWSNPVDLLNQYSFIDISVSPEWDRIAILRRGNSNEKFKYWIEIHNLSINE